MNLKKLSACLIAFCVIFTNAYNFSIFASETGDVDENGTVDSYDALLILQYVVSTAELSESQLKNADINNDGSVDSNDALSILKKIVEGETADTSETTTAAETSETTEETSIETTVETTIETTTETTVETTTETTVSSEPETEITTEEKPDYSAYCGVYTGLFGEEMSPSYTAYGINNPKKTILVSSFTLVIQNLDAENLQGYVILEIEGIEQIMYFSQMDSVEFDGSTLKLYHKGSSASTDMEIYLLDNNKMTGKIKKATILATSYDFPCTIYFRKNIE